jgi:MinD superfamily P-loop ATPase
MKIAIASGKGGTGKTTLSVNLSEYLAETRPVILTDLDVEEPNAGLFLHGIPRHAEDVHRMVPEWNGKDCTFCGLCQDLCRFHSVISFPGRVMVFPALCHGCYACSELCPTASLPMVPLKMGELRRYEIGNLSFDEGRLEVGQEQAVPLISRTLSFVEESFPPDILRIFDCPPGTSCPVIEAVRGTDFAILVTEPTPFGLHDLKLTIETLREIDRPFAVVVNRHGIGNADVEDLCRAEGIDIIARIPNDRAIAERYSRGKLAYSEVAAMREALERISTYIGNLESGAGL